MKIMKIKGVNIVDALFILWFVIFSLSSLSGRSAFAGTTGPTVELTPAEQAWLKQHPVIRLAPDPEFKPIEFFDENNNYQGIGADYARLIAEKLGITIEIIQCENWDEVLVLAQQRQVDMLNAVVKTPQREKYLLFPEPYLKIPSVIIVKKTVTRELTLEMLKGMHVVMVSGYGYVDLIRNTYPEIEIDLVADLKAALRKVSFGIADAFVGDLATASFYIELDKITNLKLAGESEPPNISGFAVRSDWPELSSILEKSIAQITDEERKTIYRKWIHLGTASGLTTKEVQIVLLGVLLVITVLVAGFLLWNRMLNRKVQERTEALQKEIAERKLYEKAFRKSEKRFLDLAKNSTDLIWEFDENEIFTYTSDRIVDLLGYTPEELIGRSAFEPMPSPEAGKIAKEFYRFKDERKPFSNLINVNTHRNGTDVIIESSGVPIIDSEGTFRGYRGIDRDITKRVNLEEELRQAHKMQAMGTMAGGIAHDFNNILVAIIGYAELAKMDSSLSDDAAGHINEVLTAGHRAKGLVEQILTFSRKNLDKNHPIEPHLVIKEALKLMRASLPTTIELSEDISEDNGLILANSTNIHQIVVNLCTNALHAMKSEQGTIEVSLRRVELHQPDVVGDDVSRSGTFVELIVRDTGCGMTKATVERIFEPYFTTRDAHKGSGMGLAVVHGIVQNCRGHIQVDSSPGRGTTFKVYFPVYAGEKSIEAGIQEKGPIPKGTERILFVDDEETVVSLCQMILEREGYHVTAHFSSLKTLELFQNSPDDFDLVITDQTMPDLRGSELAQKLREIRADIPIILCTGYSTTISEDQASELGIDKYMTKPISRRAMLLAVREVLDKSNG
ncbi:transporter substrate-binding domain-containing protein [Desulforhopalus sp. 52FAK]